jgi:hypothetical protein
MRWQTQSVQVLLERETKEQSNVKKFVYLSLWRSETLTFSGAEIRYGR